MGEGGSGDKGLLSLNGEIQTVCISTHEGVDLRVGKRRKKGGRDGGRKNEEERRGEERRGR